MKYKTPGFVKYFYFFRGTLETHVHFYKGWVDATRKNGIPMRLITILSNETFYKQKSLVNKYKKFNYFYILKYNSPSQKMFIINMFFGWFLLWNKKVVIQLKKQDINQFDFLKKLFPSRLKCILEFEGDAESEMKYLIEHPYKKGFYDNSVKNIKNYLKKLPDILKKLDCLFVLSPDFKNSLLKRYPNIKLDPKIKVLSTGVDCNDLYFSQEIRDDFRKKLDLENKFVMTYIGNVLYSWQNIGRTIEIFHLIKQKLMRKSFLMLLIRKADFEIAMEFIRKYNISKEDYILINVPHENIIGYLNASDLGFLLRDEHPMNKFASPGKFGDYIACGLPVLMTKGISDYSDMISKTRYCIVLDDMYNDDEILTKVKPFTVYNSDSRSQLARWAKDNVSINAKINDYIDVLQNI